VNTLFWQTDTHLYQLPLLYFVLPKSYGMAAHLIGSLTEYGAVVECGKAVDSTNGQKAIGTTATLRPVLLWTILGLNMGFCGENLANNHFRYCK
jgi:hypothetical protein